MQSENIFGLKCMAVLSDMVASQNLPMVPGVSDTQEVPIGVQGAPFNPRRIILFHRRPQRLGQNIMTHGDLPFS